MKKYIFLAIALLGLNSASAQLFSNNRKFNTFATTYEKWNGIALKAPSGYVDAGQDPFIWGPQIGTKGYMSLGVNYYRMRLYSATDNVMIIYPSELYFNVDSNEPDNEYNGVAEYLVSANGYKFTRSKPDKVNGLTYIQLPDEAKDFCTKYEGKQAKKWFNAERVYVAHFKLEKPFDGRFSHAMVVSMHNRGKRVYEVMCFMNGDSESLRQKVFEDLKGTVKMYDTSEHTYQHNYRGYQLIVLDFGNNFDFSYLPQPVSETDKNKIKSSGPKRVN